MKTLIGKKFNTKNGKFIVVEYNVWNNKYWCRLISGTYGGFDIGEECLFSESLINKRI